MKIYTRSLQKSRFRFRPGTFAQDLYQNPSTLLKNEITHTFSASMITSSFS